MEEWKKPETLALWITIGILFISLLVSFVLLLLRVNMKQKLLRQQEEHEQKMNHQQDLHTISLEAQEAERKRIADDLHDVLINKLIVLKLSLVSPANIDAVSLSIDTARRLSHDLSPPLLEMKSVMELIDDLLSPWRKEYKISFVTDIRIDIDYSKQKKLQLIRSLSEIITNISKHAKATKIDVHLRITSNAIALSLTDNGDGFDVQKADNGKGLKSISSRIEIIGGSIKVKSQKAKGTSTIIIIPN